MASLDIPRPQTPSHQPTYGIHVPRETIEDIVRRGFPHSKLASVVQLPSGESYNNRIYFLNISRSRVSSNPQPSLGSSEASDHEDELEELVLKANGRFFGANKIENEVASLRLLEAYCPDVPAPRVFAWSCGGLDMTFVSPEATATATATAIPRGQNDQPLSHGGWMLISRVPGEPISNLDLDEATMASVMRQLADMATIWRQHIPLQKHCGNSCLSHNGTKQEQADIHLESVRGSNGTKAWVRGVLMDGINTTAPIPSLANYYQLRLEKKLNELETSDTYAQNRPLAPLVRRFVADSLPKLGLDQGQHKFVFTHYDLSPRNVLVSGQPPRITGIVDFEFSGFFSHVEEFLNDSVGNDGDWPKEAYNAYLKRLERNGIATPGKSVDRGFWEESLRLEKLVESIAPWWLPGNRGGRELEEELKKAELVAREMMKKGEEPEILLFNPVATPGSKAFETRLVDLVAVALHQFGVIVFQLDLRLHQGDIDSEVCWTARPKKDSVAVSLPPSLTLFSHHAYQAADMYPEGVADIVGYWAEDRILGGVVVFDRRAEDADTNLAPPNIYLHSCRSRVTVRVFQLRDEQQRALVDFPLLSDGGETGAEASPPPLPVRGDSQNRVRVDAHVAIIYYLICRDVWERRPPTEEHMKFYARRPQDEIDYPESRAEVFRINAMLGIPFPEKKEES